MDGSGSDDSDYSGDEVADAAEAAEDATGVEFDDISVSVGREVAERTARENPAELDSFAEMIRQSSALRDAYAFLERDRGELFRTVTRLGEAMSAGSEIQTVGARMTAQIEGMAKVSPAFDHSAVTSILGSYSGLASTVMEDYAQQPFVEALRYAPSYSTAPWLTPSIDVSAMTAALQTVLDARQITLGNWTGIGALLDGLSQSTPGFARALKTRFRGARPANWGDDIDEALVDSIDSIVRTEGIPLAWVPRPEVLDKLLAAPDRPARIELLLEHQNDIIEDCANSLNKLQGDFASFGALASRAIQAFKDGHREAALSLAVNVLESAVNQTMPGKSIHVYRSINFPVELLPFSTLRCFMALFPLLTFYIDWKPGTGQERPSVLSRHVIAHGLTGEEGPEEPLIAIMYAASVLCGLQDWVEFDVGAVAAKMKTGKKA